MSWSSTHLQLLSAENADRFVTHLLACPESKTFLAAHFRRCGEAKCDPLVTLAEAAVEHLALDDFVDELLATQPGFGHLRMYLHLRAAGRE